MLRLSLRPNVVAACLLALLVCVMSGLAYRSVDRATSVTAQSANALAAMDALRALDDRVRDAVIAAQRVVTATDPARATAYTNATDATVHSLANLRDITSSYPAAAPRLDSLGYFVGLRLAELDEVSRFLDEGVVPAARAVGANICVPTAEDAFLSDLPADIRDRLETFSDAARKSLPFNRKEGELWREFVIAVFRTKTVIDAQSLIGWLVAAGWSKESATDLNLHFFDHCLLLSRYTDEVSAA